MQKLLLEASIKLVRQRISEGDCPVTAPLSVETLEHMVDQLAAQGDAAAESGLREAAKAYAGVTDYGWRCMSVYQKREAEGASERIVRAYLAAAPAPQAETPSAGEVGS